METVGKIALGLDPSLVSYEPGAQPVGLRGPRLQMGFRRSAVFFRASAHQISTVS